MKAELQARHEDLYLDCVHCGLCLPACPTYRVLGTEMDSPRGRIYLMRAFDEGRTAITDSFTEHMSRCLDCRACETVCPSGVQFGHMMEEMRATIVEERSTDWISRMMLHHVFPHPGRFHLLARLLQLYSQSGLSSFLRSTGLLARLAPEYAAAEELMPELEPSTGLKPGNVYSASGRARGTVAMFAGCVMNSILGGVNRSTVDLLNAAGYDVAVPADQRGTGPCEIVVAHRRGIGEACKAGKLAEGTGVPPIGNPHVWISCWSVEIRRRGAKAAPPVRSRTG